MMVARRQVGSSLAEEGVSLDSLHSSRAEMLLCRASCLH
jgi:hypothetical protein